MKVTNTNLIDKKKKITFVRDVPIGVPFKYDDTDFLMKLGHVDSQLQNLWINLETDDVFYANTYLDNNGDKIATMYEAELFVTRIDE